MRVASILFGAALLLTLPSCYATQWGIPAQVTIVNNGSVGRSGSAESNDLITGTACATSFLGWFAFGDASIRAASNQSGITRIANVSHTTEGVLGFTAKYCTVVRGWR
ncbi:MAG: TRL-like family protein [Leptospiraceae bacterium]|nr:TRL-like family protein [Leptospiraceae bacterium]